MRKAFSNFKFLEEDGKFYGVSLGYDYCAEHEWGTKEMKRRFNMDESKMGIDRLTIRKDSTILIKEGEFGLLRTTSDYSLNLTLKDNICREMYLDSKYPLQTAWDADSFGVLVYGKENIGKLEILKDAFTKNDIAITYIKSRIPVFENSSLSILIKSRLDKEIRDELYHQDKRAADLVKYEKEIGLTDLKEKTRGGYKKPKYYMACSPRWIDYENAENRERVKENLGTKYDIQYWINYSDNDDNSGWYSVEQIKHWLSTPDVKLKFLNKPK